MKASTGDRIVARGHHLGEPDRDCGVLEVRDGGGAPPYFVCWDDSGRARLFLPGPDVSVQQFDHPRPDLKHECLEPLGTTDRPGNDRGRERPCGR
jgi:hypothetical protein